MIYRLDPEHVGFPDPRMAEPDGFVAFDGGMSVEWLLNAYWMGLFPWYDNEDGIPFWYSPDPRMVLEPQEFRCSKSLRRTIRSGRFEVKVDTCFRSVIEQCAAVKREGETSSWISPNFIESYCKLHEAGFAHSFETFENGRLVGGLYGVGLSDCFCGESMFHTVTDASKVAFAKMVEFAILHGFRIIDAQMYTPHLASLGAKEMNREDFLQILEEQDVKKVIRGRWHNNSVVLLLGTNQGERMVLLMQAIAAIAKRIGTVSCASPVYETEPWGFEAEQSFLNQAIVVDTDLDAHEVLKKALEIEKDLGRVRNETAPGIQNSKIKNQNYASRPMDIDLIFFNGDVIDTPDLQVPHPRMHLRRFVLQPLLSIIPDFIHPKMLKTVRSLYEECSDNCEVKTYF